MAAAGALTMPRGRPEKREQERLEPVPMRLDRESIDKACREALRAGISLAAELRRLVRKAQATE